MRIGIAGAGAIARRHLAALAEHPDASVAAVCDLNVAVAEETAGLAGGAAAYEDWEAMLAAERLDALFVCTPPGAHLGPAAAAFERGLPVYLEKPLARSAADGEAIVAAWRASGAVCAVGYQWRSVDVLDRLRAELGGVAPGLLVSRGLGPAERGRTGRWFEDPRASGGILFELASHDIDLQRAVAGPVSEVQAASAAGLLATAAEGAPPLDDSVAVLMRFAGGGLGIVALGWTEAQQPPVYALDVMAADLALRLDLERLPRLHGRSRGADVDTTAAADPRSASVARFLDAVSGRGQSAVACSPEDALGTLRTVLAAEQAIATGERVAVAGG
ncbi:MAG TPA: Gfo/Idh/MocA family oxidoreductase [Gaiellales bacterium]|nr:Gfo/Idh/MocA family oxidoreductase [Gaiellales bacterium]